MDLSERVLLCKKDSGELNSLITEYKPFIAKVVQKQVNRFVEYGRDDELSIGLMAFEEAVKSYKGDRGSFLPFAEGVIKRRLIDYYRKENRHSNVIPLSSFYSEDEDREIDVTEEQSIESYNYSQEREYRQYEIADIQKELKQWEISFFELPSVSPKHTETKKLYREIVEIVHKSQPLLESIKNRKVYPVAEIEKITGIHRKTIERARKYVIAMIIILTGEYEHVQSFIMRSLLR